MPPRSRLWSLFFAALACSATAANVARADDAAALAPAKASYEAGRYEEGAARFRDMLDETSPRALHDRATRSRARAYYAACLLALGRGDDADLQLEGVVRDDPAFRPDPVELPGKLLQRFDAVRARLLPGADREAASAGGATSADASREAWLRYVAELERMASEEVVATRRSRLVAAVPFGVGQFQNGETGLGVAFLGVETALAGLSIASAVAWQVSVAQHDEPNVDTVALNERISTARTLNLWSTVALGAVALAGAAQAEIAFVPESREVRRRPVPRPPSVTPVVGGGPGAALFGVAAEF